MKIKARVLKRCEFSVTCHDVEQDSAVRYLRVGTAALSDSGTSDGSNLWVTRSARASHCKINVWLSFRALARYFRPNERSRRFVRWMLMSLYKRSLLSRK